MKIERIALSPEKRDRLIADLNDALSPGVEGRVCGAHCTAVCPSCGAQGCQCECSTACSNMPAMLSSDPENHPIEPRIAPLSFELRRLGFFRPCWSCEGHAKDDGTVFRIPQVWFQSDSQVHVRILTDVLRALLYRKALAAPWEIAVTHSDADNPEVTYALQPQGSGDGVPLSALQADVDTLARMLYGEFMVAAKQLNSKAGA